MNRILRFLRNLDKRKLIFILQRASAVLLPIRPYPDCGRGHCPLSGRKAQAHAGHRHRRNDRQRPYEAVNWDSQAAGRRRQFASESDAAFRRDRLKLTTSLREALSL